MSEQERKAAVPPGNDRPSVVLVDKSANNLKYKHSEVDEPDAQNKRTVVPSVISSTQEPIKNRKLSNTGTGSVTESVKQSVGTLPKIEQKKGKAPETIALTSLDVESKRGAITSPEPIPVQPSAPLAPAVAMSTDKISSSENAEDDDNSIKDAVAELRPSESSKKPTDWSDDEEAGGLPRSVSRSSRVSRGLRQLFCCGVSDSPSDDDHDTRRWSAI